VGFKNSYDAAGNVVSVETLQTTTTIDLYAQRLSYDLRWQRTTTWYLIDLSAGQSDQGVQM